MKINKIIIGFVIQKFDTDTGKYTGQDFIASDNVSYETETGKEMDWKDWDSLNVGKELNFGPHAEKEPHLHLDMVQP